MCNGADTRLCRYVIWPDDPAPTDAEFRKAFDDVMRFIDFDGTISEPFMQPRGTLCGEPLAEFLGQEPFIVQTWNPGGAIEFFTELHPDYPQPVMVIVVPQFRYTDDDGKRQRGKDFTVFCISGKIIIDDRPKHEIRAPGCIVLQPDDGLP